ncbi:hypothetical protein D9611_011880 [Ephemerocybe angulata]|uniref:Uncharacterized protein n=1 Tax=Ephemerocybe angulata TaxID=980116 RepID=A0A8H5BXL2_9AGAR|nr:hypothetical protein D9611_011880 [Tulosesus angulatus]
MSMKPRDYVVPVARKRPGKPWDEGSPCWYLDLASPPASSQEPVEEELDMVDFTNAYTEWQPRILHCIDGAEEDPEKTWIVYNVFAKMKIYTQDGKTGMAQVVSTFKPNKSTPRVYGFRRHPPDPPATLAPVNPFDDAMPCNSTKASASGLGLGLGTHRFNVR